MGFGDDFVGNVADSGDEEFDESMEPRSEKKSIAGINENGGGVVRSEMVGPKVIQLYHNISHCLVV